MDGKVFWYDILNEIIDNSFIYKCLKGEPVNITE